MLGVLRPGLGFFRVRRGWDPADVRFRIVYAARGML